MQRDAVVVSPVAGRSEGAGLASALVWIGAGGVSWAVTHRKGRGRNDRERGRGGRGMAGEAKGAGEEGVTAGTKKEQ